MQEPSKYTRLMLCTYYRCDCMISVENIKSLKADDNNNETVSLLIRVC